MEDGVKTDSAKGLSRRDFLKLVGVTGAGAVAGCAVPPAERMLPYVTPPDDQILGIATWYATTCLECPAGCGMHVRTREGRILKLEGNPDHPVNRGTLCARGQSQLQGLYNPDRIAGPKAREGNRWVDLTWDEAYKRLSEMLTAASATAGGIQFWTEGATGSWNALLGEWCASFGAERIAYEAFDYAPVREAARRAFGTGTVPLFDLSKAGYVLSLGADFLDTWGLPLAQARGYDASHSARGGAKTKHVQAEPRLSLTGHSADEWLAIRPGSEGILALGLAQKLGAGGNTYDLDQVARECDVPREKLDQLAKELSENRPGVVLGPGAAASGANATEIWTAVFALNRALGSVGTALLPSPGFEPGASVSFAEARKGVERLGSGAVKLFLVHGTNPAYTLGGSTGFAEAVRKAEFRVSFSSYLDETTALCDLVLPDLHPLESWGDAEPVRGVRGLVQPAMRPVFEKTRQTGDVLLAMTVQTRGGKPDATFRDYVMRRWGGTPDAFNESLQKGGEWPAELPGGGAGGGGSAAPVTADQAPISGQGDFVLYAFPHPYHYDGRGANKPWLQEIPDPVTKVAWESWCELHPDTARRLGVENGHGLVLETEAGHGELPVITNLLIRPDVIAVPMGYGHAQYGRYAEGRGVNVLDLLPAAQDGASGGRAWLATRVRARASGKDLGLVHTGGPGRQHDRGIARAIPLGLLAGGAVTPTATEGEPGAHGSENGNNAGAFSRGPAAGPEGGAPPLTFPTFRDRTSQLDGLHEKAVPKESIPPAGYNQYNRAHHRWGMAIDLSSCIGCSACVAACYAENNIAWVGKQNMKRGREMAWIRIERYYEDVEGGIEPRFAPMMCQQCGSAPCETVCPVYATYHNPEGLNIQVYNRCVGTRYCSNNCPYKVRAFNWFDYDCWTSPLHLQLNPDLTVRSKGVMEKCTFCVQRIRQARDVARDESRDVKDGDITPACAQTCPTQAIVFGDLADPGSRVAKLAQDARGYHVLGDLNTLPAITYLQKVSRRAVPSTTPEAEHGGA